MQSICTLWGAGAQASRSQALSQAADRGYEILPMRDIPQIKYLAGVHPYGAPDYTDDVHAQVVAALDDPLCAGIGEIGLDYHMDYDDDIAPAPHDVQIDCMARQLEVAVRRNVPVQLHLRHAATDEERTSHVDA